MIRFSAFRQRPGTAALGTLAAILSSLTLMLSSRAPLPAAAESPKLARLAVKHGDHVCIIGNTLADRMQHDGWLETFFQSRFPRANLVFRNLGFSGDELTLRLRSEGFGSPDYWLKFHKTDVVLAFFGYNESFGGEEGLGKFKADLQSFIKHTLGQQYNGKSAPRLVLFSPIGHENLHDRNLPDGTENNKRLALYTKVMAEIARANDVPFVDLFHPTLELYQKAKKPLTINGIHLTEHGNRLLAEIIDKALFPGRQVKRDEKALAKLRQAVLDKNFYWFNRYRTLDGYNVYGGRSYMRYNGITNREVMFREMDVLDVMAANRDRRVWAVAQGHDLKVDDSNTPPFIPVTTNKPGPGPNGTWPYLDGETAIKKMTTGKGLKVNLFASEKEWPELAKPVQMAFDGKGRLWVAVWPSYPHWKPKEEMNDKILIFEDTKGTGKADKMTVFADHLHCPTGFCFYNGGVLVAQAPGLLFLKDTKGTGKADLRVRVLDGLDSADTHHTANSFAVDPGGAVYFQEGVFHHTQVETPWGPAVHNVNGGVYRFEPRTDKFEVYVPYGFANPHGHTFTYWGQDIVVDGTGANPYDAALISGHLDFPQKHPGAPQVYQQRTRPCPGITILSSKQFPPEFRDNLLVANVIGFQGILRYKLEDKGASFAGTELEPIISSTDPNFRPSDIRVGPDGAIYFLDWQNTIIGHLQHHLRDPNRDRTHGRIYRVVYEGRPLLKQPKVEGQPVEKLLELLKEPENRLRSQARIELGARDTDKVIAAVKQWIAGLDKKDPSYEHNLLEALWVYQNQNVVNEDLLKRVLSSPEFHARAAATRVLCYWRDRVPDALDLLKKLAADKSPRVRLQAVRAASFFKVPEAIEVALVSQELPSDIYLDYVRTETLKALDPYVKQALAAGKKIAFTTPAGARFFLKSVSTDDLLKMKRSPGVYQELLARKGVRDEFRQEALAGLAKAENKDELRILLDAIWSHDEKASGPGAGDDTVVFDLVRLLVGRSPKELATVRPELVRMATRARQPVIRQLGYVALVAADNGVEPAWKLAGKSVRGLRDFVTAMPLIKDPGQRAELYPRVKELLDGLPKDLAARTPKGKVLMGRYVRIELPGRRKTLTLAEVEVYSGGRNVARQGKATQSSTAYGGDASRGIDGNRSGRYGDGGQTHTQENGRNPWWQVDLGAEYPIESIVVYNRTDGGLGNRLNGFTLKVLDGQHSVVFEKKKIPAPRAKSYFAVGAESPELAVRHAAMNALISVRGQEEETFKALAKFLKSDADRQAAVQAIQRIPTRYWPKEEAKPLLADLLAYIRKVPVAERTSAAALEALQLADSLAALLPRAEAKAVRRELGELGVRVLRIGTVPDQMLFDKDRLVVKAGKPVEIIFENNDIMPHNFVITKMGALEEVGKLAEATGTDPGAAGRNYVPVSDKVLFASRLLPPREVQHLRITAPSKPGVYPYVCTFPGHWLRMYGALYVVPDLEEYLADPEGYLAKNPLPVADQMLKFNRPRKEWKFEELASSVEDLHGRSYVNGKRMFQVATCFACHKLEGVGTQIGPDLTQLDPKYKPTDVLKDIIEPSFRINEKFQTYVFEMDSGKVITGLILEETPKTYKVIENPLAKTPPVVLQKDRVVDKKKSPTSIMPKGLLDKLTHDEILDLVAYIYSRANPKHPVFQGGHDHAHHHESGQ